MEDIKVINNITKTNGLEERCVLYFDDKPEKPVSNGVIYRKSIDLDNDKLTYYKDNINSDNNEEHKNSRARAINYINKLDTNIIHLYLMTMIIILVSSFIVIMMNA